MNFGSEKRTKTYQNVQAFSAFSDTRWHPNYFSHDCCDAEQAVDIYGRWFLVKLRRVDIYGTRKFCIESMNTAFSYLFISIFSRNHITE